VVCSDKNSLKENSRVEVWRPDPLEEPAFSRHHFLRGLGEGLDEVGWDHERSVAVGVDDVTWFDVGAADVHWYACFEDLDEGSSDSHSASEVPESQRLYVGEVAYEAIGERRRRTRARGRLTS